MNVHMRQHILTTFIIPRSQTSEEDNRTRSRSNNCKCEHVCGINKLVCNCRLLSPVLFGRFALTSLSLGQTRKHCCGNICDSRCFLKCFPVCPLVKTLLRKQNLLPGKQNCFLPISETSDVSLCFSLMFPSVCPLWETRRNIGRKQCFRNNVS